MNTIERIKCGNGNCYLIKENDKAILVDTAREKYKNKILEICKKNNVQLIVLTHGHVDHVQNAAFLSKELGVPVAINKADLKLLGNNMNEKLSAHKLLGRIVLKLSEDSFKNDIIPSFMPSVYLNEGDSLSNFGINCTVIQLPGHTEGSIGLNVWGTDLLVGDALMNMFYPTVSMLYGDKKQMLLSADKISKLGKIKIHFGHGKALENRIWIK